MRSFSITILLPVLLASYVSAHGYVRTLGVGGKDYHGNVPEGQKDPSPIRQITTNSPVKGANNPDMNCGPGATPGSLIADANPGDTLSFDWSNGDPNQNWPHNTGPMLTYLANCGETTCDKFDSRQAKWFKIDQVGRKPNSGEWFQGDLMKGARATAKIPGNLKAGNYLVRHEIIGLHLAQQEGGAEFYPSCSQLRIGGSGTGVPTQDELVSFPGAYGDEDKGIRVNAFDSNTPYVFPGPPISKLAASSASPSTGNGGNGGNNGNSGNSGNSGSSTTPTGTSGNNGAPQTTKVSKPGKVCKLKRKSSAAAAKPTGDVYRRHYSRVMRRLALEDSTIH